MAVDKFVERGKVFFLFLAEAYKALSFGLHQYNTCFDLLGLRLFLLKMKCSFPPRLFPHTFSQVVSSPTPKLAFPQQPKKIVVISPTMAVISPKHKYFYVLGIVLHCKVHIKTLSSHSYTVLSYKNSCTYYFLSHKHKPVLL